jgi:hypothetical protein
MTFTHIAPGDSVISTRTRDPFTSATVHADPTLFVLETFDGRFPFFFVLTT